MIVDIRLVSLRDYLRTNLIGAIDYEVSKVALTEMVKASSAVGVPNLLGPVDVGFIIQASGYVNRSHSPGATDPHAVHDHGRALGGDGAAGPSGQAT